jgi:hypothetical protein
MRLLHLSLDRKLVLFLSFSLFSWLGRPNRQIKTVTGNLFVRGDVTPPPPPPPCNPRPKHFSRCFLPIQPLFFLLFPPYRDSPGSRAALIRWPGIRGFAVGRIATGWANPDIDILRLRVSFYVPTDISVFCCTLYFVVLPRSSGSCVFV